MKKSNNASQKQRQELEVLDMISLYTKDRSEYINRIQAIYPCKPTAQTAHFPYLEQTHG